MKLFLVSLRMILGAYFFVIDWIRLDTMVINDDSFQTVTHRIGNIFGFFLLMFYSIYLIKGGIDIFLKKKTKSKSFEIAGLITGVIIAIALLVTMLPRLMIFGFVILLFQGLFLSTKKQ